MALSPAVGVALSLSCLFVALPRVIARREARAASPAAVRFEPLERRCIDLRQLLEEMPRASGAALRAAGIDVDQRLPDGALCVWADADELRRMLAHIARMACDAMPRGGVLRILARPEGDAGRGELHGLEPRIGTAAAGADLRSPLRRAAEDGPGPTARSARAPCCRGASPIATAAACTPRPRPLGGLGLTLRMPLAKLDAAPAAWGAPS